MQTDIGGVVWRFNPFLMSDSGKRQRGTGEDRARFQCRVGLLESCCKVIPSKHNLIVACPHLEG